MGRSSIPGCFSRNFRGIIPFFVVSPMIRFIWALKTALLPQRIRNLFPAGIIAAEMSADDEPGMFFPVSAD